MDVSQFPYVCVCVSGACEFVCQCLYVGGCTCVSSRSVGNPPPRGNVFRNDSWPLTEERRQFFIA